MGIAAKEVLSSCECEEALAYFLFKRNDRLMGRGKIVAYLFSAFLFGTVGRLSQAQQHPAATVENAQQALLQLAVADTMETTVPTSIQDGIGNLKHALVLQTDELMSHLPPNATADSIKQRLSAAMPASTVGKLSDEQWTKRANADSKPPTRGLYGGELTVSVSVSERTLVLVQESFDIACGNDTVLLGYTSKSGAWKRTLLWESKPYDKISGAFGDTFQTLPLKPRHEGHPLLLVLHGTPWCTSTMSVFDMDIIELGNFAAASPFWHGAHSYRRLDLDPPLTLRPTADGFEVRTSLSGGGDSVSRRGVIRYAITGTGVHRVEPLAINGRDSIVEWLELPRREAVELADEPLGSPTWQMFDDFTYEGKSKNANVPSPNFGAVRACKDSGSHFQVEVTSQMFDDAANASKPGPTYFVQLRQVPNGYRVHAVTHVADAACTGPDIMRGS